MAHDPFDNEDPLDWKTMRFTAKKWVDWYTASKGFRVIPFSEKKSGMTRRALVNHLSNPRSGLCLSDIKLQPGDPNSLFDLVPGSVFLDDLIKTNGQWKYPNTEVLLAVGAD